MAKFSKIEDVLSKKQEGKTVKIRGWVYRKREMKDKIFLVIRDTSDIIQAVIDSKSESWQDAQKITVESSVELEGIIHEDKRAPTGFEMQTKSLHIVGLAERWPISRDKSDEFLLDVRHLWVRSRQLQAVFKIRSKVFEAIHEYFRTHDYYEVQSPIFTPAAGEGGSTQFEVKYFGKKLFLAQTWQLYAEAMLPSLERIYCIAPSFRAEKSRTTRHLTEYWHAEMEVAWMDFDGLQKAAEELVSHICQKVSKDCVKELEVLG
ncbi:asparagine--tRNA ligase, partial [Candidatus Woesearchaeota archaeon]|nr:asparagine--tRNA ligase [Candidatus Woesearchaeota archaeon]